MKYLEALGSTKKHWKKLFRSNGKHQEALAVLGRNPFGRKGKLYEAQGSTRKHLEVLGSTGKH